MLPPDGYAALKRWLDIFENPGRMEKLFKAKLDGKQKETIMEVAIGDDDAAFYEALIRENVEQLNSSGTSPQEVARLTTNINIFRKELKDIRSRKPKEGTTLAQVLAAANAPRKAKKKPVATPVKERVTSREPTRATKSKKTSIVSSRSKK